MSSRGSSGWSASTRWCGSSASSKLPDRSLTLRYRFAHHMYQNACFDVAARDAQGRAEPRDRRAAGAALRRADRAACRISRCCSRSRATACAPPNTGTVPRRRPAGSMRTTNPRASRSGAWRSSPANPPSPARSAAELGAAHDLRAGDQDQQGLRGRRSRPSLRARPRAQPPGRGSRRASSRSSSACRRTTSSRARSGSRTTSRSR